MTDMINAEMEEININTEVLVIGGGLTGLKAASEIAASGYKVSLIEKESDIGFQEETNYLFSVNKKELASLEKLIKQVKNNNQIEVFTQTQIKGVTGVTGDFNVTLSKENELKGKKVGAIIIATDFSVEPLNEKYGLSLSKNVLTQSQMEELLAPDNKSGREKLANKTVAFVVGFAQDGYPLVMERVMRSVLAAEETDGCNAYVYAGDLKVASDGLEMIYKDTRDNGATYFKLKEAPNISQDGKKISFYDDVLRRDMELSPDLLIVEEAVCADQSNEGLAELLRIDMGPLGFLQKDNVHLFPVCSNREGIFVVGATREVQDLPLIWTDVENVSLKVKNLLGDGTRMVPKEKAVVDTGKCVFCLTCYRCCPHGAIYWDEDNKAVISKIACQACGICASECPMDAIQIGGFKDEDIKVQIQKCIETGNNEPNIIAFCCQNSAFEAGEMAEAFNMPLPAGLKTIKVPCAGKVDIDYILSAFLNGADGVLVMTCHNGNCKSEQGNIFANMRVGDAHKMFEETGFESDRLKYVTLASNMGQDFSSAVIDMERKVKELGLSALRN